MTSGPILHLLGILIVAIPVSLNAQMLLPDPNLLSAWSEALRLLSDNRVRQTIMRDRRPRMPTAACPCETQDFCLVDRRPARAHQNQPATIVLPDGRHSRDDTRMGAALWLTWLCVRIRSVQPVTPRRNPKLRTRPLHSDFAQFDGDYLNRLTALDRGTTRERWI